MKNTTLHKLGLFFLLSFAILPALAAVFTVGPAQTYTSPNALYLANDNGSVTISNGDTIFIEAALYEGTPATAVWHADSLLIRGINGQPHMKANGAYIWQKAIWVAAGDDLRVENIEFSECAVPDQNGAGIRLDGTGLKIKHCYFHDNENGILTSNPNAGNLIVEHSEFDHNGFGDGYTHNIYVGHIDTFVLRFCYMHHAYIGHNVKSRAKVNYIEYNRIMDEYTGQSSYLVNLPNGGFSVLVGNLLMQGQNAENKVLVDYGSEGLSNPVKQLYVINNTMVNERVTGTFVQVSGVADTAKVMNNVMIGTGDVAIGATDTSHNFYFADTVGVGLANVANFDYHLTVGSLLINAGGNPGLAASYGLAPVFEYAHPLDSTTRFLYSGIDVGAYEFPEPVTVVQDFEENRAVDIYPNPTSGFVFIGNADKLKIESISLSSIDGKVLLEKKVFDSRNVKLDLSAYPNGLYFLSVVSENTGKRTMPINKR